MNGRLYDPLLHRFLAPDNFVQDPTNSQNFNRYGYVMNNPLKYTDKSGEFWEYIIGAAISVITNGINNAANNRPFFAGAGQAAFLGFVGGGLSSGIGGLTSGIGGLGGAAMQAVAHATLGGIMSVANGGSFGPGFLSGLASSLTSSGVGALLKGASRGVVVAGMYGSGALSGGLGSASAGGSFWDGARNGAITAGLNHLAHMITRPKTTVAGIYGAGGESAGDNPALKALVEGEGGKMFTSSVGGGDSEIIEYLKAGHDKGHLLKLYGYSRGGAAAVRIANKLGAMGIDISEIVLFDPVGMYFGGRFEFKHDNVDVVRNFYQRNPVDKIGWWADNPFKGSRVSGASYTNTIIENINLTGKSNNGKLINHLNIISYATDNYPF
jgi:hypothetical protein